MEINKVSEFIKRKRKDLGITQEELAEKLFVTEKAISRWETGRGTPDISLLIPLSKELNVDVSELLNGEDNIESVIKYREESKKYKYNIYFKLTIFFYIISILLFLIYLRFEYDPSTYLNYFIRLFIVVISSIFIIIGNNIYSDKYVDTIEDKNKVSKLSHILVFIYYVILLFNMAFFARYTSVDSYNIIPLKSILEILSDGDIYSIVINIFGNLLVFIPLEYFIIELFKINKFYINFITSFIIIFIVELLQLIFKVGVFDIDDLILCTIGMMLFYFVYNKFINHKS